MWPSISPLSLQSCLFTPPFSILSPICLPLTLSILRCFWTLGDSHQKICLYISKHFRLFLLFVFIFFLYLLPVAGNNNNKEKTKSTDCFILSCLHNYKLLITRRQLGPQHSLNNQAGGITSCVQTRRAHHNREAGWGENTKRNNEVLGWKQHENNTAGFTL